MRQVCQKVLDFDLDLDLIAMVNKEVGKLMHER